MREIKFRGKRVDNGEWVYGDLAKYLDGSPFIMPKPYFATRDLCDEDERGLPILSDEMALGGFISVIPETVGQFIGKNKSGQEFFEGDITEQGVILYSEEKSVFCENFKNSFTKQLTISCYPMAIERAKLLANIHDNPELL